MSPEVPGLKMRAKPMHPLADGGIRKLRSFERHRLCEHLLRLNAEERRMRFCGSANDAFIRRYCDNTGPANDIVLGYFAGGELRGAGELKFHRDGVFRVGAEVALSVETPFQGSGVGTRLLRRLTVLARNRGVGKIHILCLRENAAMQKIASKLGADVKTHEYDAEGTARLHWPSHLTLVEEAMADGYEVLRLVLGLDRAPKARRG